MAENFDLDDDELEQPTATPEKPATVLVEEVMKGAMPAAVRRKLAQTNLGYALLLVVPDAKWGRICARTLVATDMQCRVFLEAPKNKASEQDPAMVRSLSAGQRLVLISPDPVAMMPDVIRRAADDVVTIGTPSLSVMRKVIRRVTGRTVRGLKVSDYSGLDFDLLVSTLRPEARPVEIVRRLRSLTAKPDTRSAQVPAVPLLSQIPLTNAVRAWTDEMLEELAAVKAGALDPSALIYATLEGPPGTGKTLIANALAATAGWAFVSSSVGAWFTTGDGALGGVARNVRSFVDSLLAAQPAIGFLDECDAIPNRATMDNRGRDWWLPVITLVLTEIDRLRGSGRSVMLLGATNYYEHLDAALTRPGRLQQRVSVLPPSTEDEVLALFRHYLGDDLPQAEQQTLASVAIGATPATVEGWVKAARASARIERGPLTAGHLLTHMAPADARNAADLRTAALHELGHAIVATEVGHHVERVSIVAGPGNGGVTSARLASTTPTLDQVRDIVTICLAGRAADLEVGGGANIGAESDLATATELLMAAHQRQGLGTSLVTLPPSAAATLSRSVDTELKHLLQRAILIVRKHEPVLRDLADQLLKDRIISGDAVRKAVNGGAQQVHSRSKAPIAKAESTETTEPSPTAGRMF